MIPGTLKTMGMARMGISLSALKANPTTQIFFKHSHLLLQNPKLRAFSWISPSSDSFRYASACPFPIRFQVSSAAKMKHKDPIFD